MENNPFADLVPQQQSGENPFADLTPSQQPEEPFGVTDTWPFRLGRGMVRSLEDAATLPGDVYTGKQDVEDPSVTGRAMNFATMAMPQAKGAVDLAPKVAAPSGEALSAAGDAAYEFARNSNVALPAAQVNQFSKLMQRYLQRKGFFGNEQNAPNTFAVLKELQRPNGAYYSGVGGTGKSVQSAPILSAADYINLRQAFQKHAQSFGSPKDQKAATEAIDKLDQFFDKAPHAGFVAGTPGEIDQVRHALKEARGNFAAGFRSDLLSKRQHKAELQTAATNSGRNLDNKLRQTVAGVLTSPKSAQGHSAAEIAEMERIVGGVRGANAARLVGNMMGGGGGLGAVVSGGLAGGGIGAAMGSPSAALFGAAVPAVGMGVKGIENALTKRAMNKLGETIRLRSPLGEKAKADAGPDYATAPMPMASEQALRLLTLYQLQNPDQM
jgi:hypothetical protein